MGNVRNISLRKSPGNSQFQDSGEHTAADLLLERKSQKQSVAQFQMDQNKISCCSNKENQSLLATKSVFKSRCSIG
jgi:hypothetical protein